MAAAIVSMDDGDDDGAVIGARRLHTIIERVLDDISFTATDKSGEKVIVDSKYIKANLGELTKDTDLSKFIL